MPDLAWLALFGGLAAMSPTRLNAEFQILAALAAFQIAEPRLPYFRSGRGAWASVAVKLGLAYLLIGVTGGVTSSYYLVLILPVVSAATRLGAGGTVVASVAAAAAYLSFLLFVDWARYQIVQEQVRELGLRVVLLGMVAFLTNQLGAETVEEARKHREAADQLAAANESLRQAEAAVRRSERLAALGQLTAGLAHELRNPLGTMKASADVLLRKIPPEDAVARELAGFITSEVDRLNALITKFLEMSRPLEPRLEMADITHVLDRAVAEIERHQPPYPVSIYRNYSPGIPPLGLDAMLIERAVYNLLLNAVQASPPGAAVTLKTRLAGGTLEISVIDRGAGVRPEHIENIFNPFFTTKPDGVGLGLALAARIADSHGGKIAVESTPGEGSVFRVLLPHAPA